jgi:molecular chaperone GrpE (heat shock protein)
MMQKSNPDSPLESPPDTLIKALEAHVETLKAQLAAAEARAEGLTADLASERAKVEAERAKADKAITEFAALGACLLNPRRDGI